MPSGVNCTGDFALFYVGTDAIGTSSWELLNISRFVQPGWQLHRTEQGDITLDFTLANPEGKFTYASSPDFIELKTDIPVLLAVGANVFFYGIVDKPPVEDTPDGSTASVSCVGRQHITRYEDVTKRYLVGEWDTVEDIIYDIIYEATSLNSYYDISYVKPNPEKRHPLLRDFIFNNRDAHTAIKELVEYHNLRFYMDVDKYGVDYVITSRAQVDNVVPALNVTISEDNALDFQKDRGSDIFFNRVKVIARTDEGDVLVAEQQDVDSIVDEGLHVRPVEDIGSVNSQTEVQSYAEYLIAKHSKSNYTTTINLDPTKFNEDELWDLRPLDVVKVTHEKLGLGSDAKFVVQEVTITGETDQITGFSIVLNHKWRNAQIMRFEEQPLVYDDTQVMDDEELIHSRVMTAAVQVKGYWNIIDDTPSNNYYPSDQFTSDGYHGFTDIGKQVLKTNWLRDPAFSGHGVPSNPFTMRPTSIYPLNAQGWVYGKHLDDYNQGYYTEGTNGFNVAHGNGSGGGLSYHEMTIEQEIVATKAMTVEGLLVCSRLGGKVEKIVGTTGYGINNIIVDNPKYLRIGMPITIKGRNPNWPKYPTAEEFTEYTFHINYVDFETGQVDGHIQGGISQFDPTATFWYCDALPIAYVDYDTPVSFANTDTGSLQWVLRFYNEADTYGEVNLSTVTLWGLVSIGERFDGTSFDENFDGDTFYKPPINLAIGLNENGERFEVQVSHMKLVDEIARSSDITAGDEFVTSVSESAKVTAKFRSNVVPPQIARGTLTQDASASATTVWFDNVDGVEAGDMVFFSDSASGGAATWSYNVTDLAPNFIKHVGTYNTSMGGYEVGLRHGLAEAKKGNVTDGYTKWSTGKLKDRMTQSIKEFGLFSEPIDEREVESYYLGNRTGLTGSPATVGNPFSSTDNGMGYGDYQYDELQDEDSIEKTSDSPPSFFSEEMTQTMDYLIDVTGVGFSTIPIMGMFQGSLPEAITFDELDNYGRKLPLKEVINRYMNIVVGPLGAMNISPLSKMSAIEAAHKGHRITKEYYPSKWRVLKRNLNYGTQSQPNSSWLFNNKYEAYRNNFSAQLFVFAVDNDIGQEDLKELNINWRGSARSWDGDEYRDGVSVFVWHTGDNQPAYSANDDGSYEIVGRVGDARTFHKHWEKVEMVNSSTGEEHDSVIPSGELHNPMTVLRSNINGGADNRVGINRVGYMLEDGNKIFVLVTTKYSAVTSSKKPSWLATDFIGLSIGTSNIFDSQVKEFRKGVDFYYDPEWKFISWPPRDYTWDATTSDYDTTFQLTELATIAADADKGTYAIHNTGSSWLVPGAVLVLVKGSGTGTPSGQTEIVTVNPRDTNHKDFFYRTSLNSPLTYDWKRNDKIYGYIGNATEFPIQVLKKSVTPDFPARAYVNESLTTVEGFSGNLTENANKGTTSIKLSNTAGLRKDDVVCVWRNPSKDTESDCGYDWRRIVSDVQYDDTVNIQAIRRENTDDGGTAYDDGASDDKTEVGIVKFPCPTIPEGFSLSWLTDEGAWEDGDAAGGKWKYPTAKWGRTQYPNIEAVVHSSGSFLSSSSTPSYTGWDIYGGPGVKIEYYDAENGYVWLTKAKNITLYDGYDENQVDTTAKIEDRVFSGLAIEWAERSTPPDNFAMYTNVNAPFGKCYTSYGNRSTDDSNVQKVVKVARNANIYLKKFEESTGNIGYFQLSIAESIDATSSPKKLKIKYRCLEASGQTCIRVVEPAGAALDIDKTWHLDAPFFEHATDDIYDYYDTDTGNVNFVLDAVVEDRALETDNPDSTISAGSESFTLAGRGADFEKHDLVLFRNNTNTEYEIVQVTDIQNNTIYISTPLLNSYTTSDHIKWKWDDAACRVHFVATQVYGPLETGDTATLSSNLYRAAKYKMRFARETSNMLVYSLLKDSSVFRPVTSDMADTLQFIQEVKFKYLEKDMV